MLRAGRARGGSARDRRGCGRGRSTRDRTRRRRRAPRKAARRAAHARAAAGLITAITAPSSAAASRKRSPAPHCGSSSRLLTRTPTAFPPASTVPTVNAPIAVRSRRVSCANPMSARRNRQTLTTSLPCACPLHRMSSSVHRSFRRVRRRYRPGGFGARSAASGPGRARRLETGKPRPPPEPATPLPFSSQRAGFFRERVSL